MSGKFILSKWYLDKLLTIPDSELEEAPRLMKHMWQEAIRLGIADRLHSA